MTPTQRTLALFRKHGYRCAIVEKWNMHSKIRQDMFGFIDIVAVGNGEIIGIQATSGSNVSSRCDKVAGIEAARDWLLSRGQIAVVGWRKVGARGKRKLWEPRVLSVELAEAGLKFVDGRRLLASRSQGAQA